MFPNQDITVTHAKKSMIEKFGELHQKSIMIIKMMDEAQKMRYSKYGFKCYYALWMDYTNNISFVF